jgi:hypothetical protein
MLVATAYVEPAAGAPEAEAGQSAVMPAPDVPAGAMVLGSVRIPRQVMADGKPLRAGTYQLRLTPDMSKPDAVGQTPPYERWVEFVQGGQVRGREVVSIVPAAEIGRVAEASPPRPGGARVELLKGGDYYRAWLNRDGVHYLVHLPTGGSTM